MTPRSFGLLALLSLCVAACSAEVEPVSEGGADPAEAQVDTAQGLAEEQAKRAEETLQRKLEAKAAAAKAAGTRGGEPAASGAQAPKAAGLTPEQERKRQAILDRKAALRAGGGKVQGYEGPSGRGPRLAFSRSSLHFGEVWDTDTMNGSFDFENVGQSTLVIDEVKASCGCTTTELDQMVFEPGEGSTIEVEWHPKGHGPQVKSITITSNNEGQPYTRLMVHAEIKPFAQWDPEPTRFGKVRIFETHQVRSTLSSVDPDFELLGLVSSNPHLTAEEVERRANGDRVIELTLDDSAPWGMFNATISAQVRGVREAGEEAMEHLAVLHVGASIFGDLEVSPNLFSVGRVPPRGRISYSVLLTSTSGEDFDLVKAEVLNPQPEGLTLRSEPAADGSLRVFVEGDVGDYQGYIRGIAVLETDLEGEGERRLPIMGIVRN